MFLANETEKIAVFIFFQFTYVKTKRNKRTKNQLVFNNLILYLIDMYRKHVLLFETTKFMFLDIISFVTNYSLINNLQKYLV